MEAVALGFAWPGATRPSLVDVHLHLAAGECVWLTGATGSGKSTLLRALAGVLPADGRSSGRVRTAGRPGLLFQNVDTQLLCTTVEEEVALALGGPGVRVRDALGRVGLRGFERRAVDALSAGEKQRVVLAALLALEPRVLLFDEPASALDPAGRRALAAVLATLKRRGHALVVADHVLEPWAELADRRLVLKEGRLVEVPGAWPGTQDPTPPPAPARPAAPPEPVLRCDALGVADAAGRALLADVSLRLGASERLLVTGPNGAGKTTLLRALAALVPPAHGARRVEGRVGLLFQNPQRNLFERTVSDEVAFGLRRLGLGRRAAAARVDEVLDLCELAALRDRSPLRVSFGEQHRVALASVLAPRPALLLLDEPFAGLDLAARGRLLDVVAREQERSGATVVLASHDERPWWRWAHRRVRLEDGRMCDA